MITLYSHLNREQAHTFSLVLSSAGIGNRVLVSTDGYRIDVPRASAETAQEVIRRYQVENPVAATDGSAGRSRLTINHLSGILVSMVLITIHLAVVSSAAPQDYIGQFGADARRILDGEVVRCATALLLHADAAHLAGNVAGIVLFGGAVCAVTGFGVGWLMILICGVLGNLINAVAHESGHLSIGASTAVFGAVGILCGLQALSALRTGKGWKRMMLIFGSGLALLAFLGTSARSDMGAHLFGFLAGVPIGGGYGLWIGTMVDKKGQLVCAALAAAGLWLSWILA